MNKYKQTYFRTAPFEFFLRNRRLKSPHLRYRLPQPPTSRWRRRCVVYGAVSSTVEDEDPWSISKHLKIFILVIAKFLKSLLQTYFTSIVFVDKKEVKWRFQLLDLNPDPLMSKTTILPQPLSNYSTIKGSLWFCILKFLKG